MHLYIEDINLGELKKFTEQLDRATKDEKINIFIHSFGGELDVAEQLIEIINNIENDTTFVVSFIGSCAFDVALGVKKKKHFLKQAYGAVHIDAWNTSMATKTIGRGDFARFKLTTRPDTIEPLDYLTEEENKIYQNGDDVYLGYERLKEIFKF